MLDKYVLSQNLRDYSTTNVKNETEAFQLLSLLDDVLPPTANRKIPKKDLQAWKEALEKLVNSLNEAFDDDVLKAFVEQQLSSVIWAISNYRWLGIDGVSRVYGAATAELARSQGMKMDRPLKRVNGMLKPKSHYWR